MRGCEFAARQIMFVAWFDWGHEATYREDDALL